MKILERNENFGIEQICSGSNNGGAGCGSKLFVETNDIYLTHHTDLIGDTDFYYTFKCPVCGRETDIPDKLVPYAIQHDLFDNYKAKTLSRGR